MMEINELTDMHERLSLEGKTRAMDNPDEIKAIFEMNEFMKKVHEDYLAKSAGSSIGAKDCRVYQNNT